MATDGFAGFVSKLYLEKPMATTGIVFPNEDLVISLFASFTVLRQVKSNVINSYVNNPLLKKVTKNTYHT